MSQPALFYGLREVLWCFVELFASCGFGCRRGLTLDFEIAAVLAANRIDRKNEIDAVPAISPYIRFEVKLSTRCSELYTETLPEDVPPSFATPLKSLVETKCAVLNHLLQELGVSHVDYFSLDVGGAEMFVLESIDFSTITFDVFTIEIQEHRAEIEVFMKNKGYSWVGGRWIM